MQELTTEGDLRCGNRGFKPGRVTNSEQSAIELDLLLMDLDQFVE